MLANMGMRGEKSMVWKLQLSGVLAFVAMILTLVAATLPEPYATFLPALAVFITALSALLVSLGLITLVKKLEKKNLK